MESKDELTCPYSIVIQEADVSIEPYNMNTNIVNNILFNLQKNLEKKCNVNGYIEEIYNIVNYSDGYMPAENLLGNAIFSVSYSCKLCKPIENNIIIGIVKIISSEIIICTNGQIYIFVPKENIDINIWNISDNFLINKINKNKLEISHYVKIKIKTVRINTDDKFINAIGILLDIPTQEEIDNYYTLKPLNNSNFII